MKRIGGNSGMLLCVFLLKPKTTSFDSGEAEKLCFYLDSDIHTSNMC